MVKTYIKVKGVWKYLYRTVDKQGKTVDFLLTAKRDKASAVRFFDKAIANQRCSCEGHYGYAGRLQRDVVCRPVLCADRANPSNQRDRHSPPPESRPSVANTIKPKKKRPA